jgi:hypothetical protein
MRIRRSLALASLLGIAIVSACTAPSEGDPRPVDPTGSTTSSSSGNGEEELPFAGAPKVNDPLDTSRYEEDPCRSLTSAQAQSLNLPPTGTFNEATLTVGCEWFNTQTRGQVNIDFVVDDPRGLSPEYQANRSGKWEFFKELPTIEGYPAVARAGIDSRDDGTCTVVVGVADDMAFASSVQLSLANIETGDPCKKAAEVAGLALQTMKAGA